MSDKFPPKNSGFRLETFRFPSDVTPCRHAIYHHGCPSCDERDPEGDDNDLVVGAPTREDGDSPTCDEVDTRVKWADQLLQREVIRRKQYRAERDRLASLLEKLRPYLTHRDYCEDGAICVCDLADLLTEMENG